MEEFEKDWKLRLRYGKLVTPFKHFTILADGEAGILSDGFNCSEGPAFMSMKIWAESYEEAADVYQTVCNKIGFKITGELQIYDTPPEEPPSDNPSAYGINFSSYKND